MIIRKARIFGFGKWLDKEFVFPEENLVCFYGENESGKSSLRQFLVFMLFGMAPKDREAYHPKRGSVSGGQLFIEDSEHGSFMIERREGVERARAICTFNNGKKKDDQWLQSYLQGMDLHLFERIFSYSTEDLFEIHLAKGENLGELLLNIGLTGYSNLHELERNLQTKRLELFRPQGSIPLLNEALRSFDEQEKKLLDIKREVAEYKPKQDQYYLLSDKMTRLEAEYSKIEKQREETERKLHNYQAIYQYFLRKKELSNFPEDLSFPTGGLERLKELKEQKNPLISELKVLQNSKEILSAEIEQINKTLKNRLSLDEIDELLDLQDDYKETTKNYKNLEAKIHNLIGETKGFLDQLNISLDYSTLTELSLPFYVEGIWQDINKDVTGLLQERKNAENQRDTITVQRDQLQEELKQIESKKLSDDEQREYEGLLEQKEQYHKQKQKQKQRKEWTHYQQRRLSLHKGLLFGSSILFILLIVAGYFLSQSSLYIFSVLAIIFGLSQYFFGHQVLKQTEKLFQLDSKNIRAIDLDRVKQIESILKEQDDLKDEMRFLNQSITKVELKKQEVDLQLQAITNREREMDKEINEQINKYPFLEGLEVRFWPEIYTRLHGLLRKIEEINRLKEESLEEKQGRASIVQKVQKIYQTAYKDEKEETVEKIFQSLESYKDELNRLHIEKNGKIDAIKDIKSRMKSLRINLQHLQDEEGKLFAQAKAKTEEEFFQREEKYRRQRDVLTTLEELKNQLTLIFSDDRYKQFDITKESEEQLEEQLLYQKTRLENLRKEMDHLRKKLAQLELMVKNLESSESYSNAIQRRAIEEGRLQELASEWAILQVAEDLLEKTKRTYQGKYLNDLLELAEDFFKEITKGSYLEIIPPSEKSDLRVESSKGDQFEIKQLSQGTIEQLYLSLKLALGTLISDQYKLPFMLDDAFIHFDERRLGSMLKIIKQISKDRQIFLFTCKKEVVKKINPRNIISFKGEDD